MHRKYVLLLLVPLLLSCFLSVGYCLISPQDTSILSMNGENWSLKIDSTLQTAIDSKASPYVSVAKAGAEKELFLTLNSSKDCVNGQISFKVETQGLTIYKQLALTEEEIKQGYIRPENVVNSFACFDKNGRKVLHIYASKLIDAKGNSVWLDSDLKDGLLTVYLDMKWLETAVFPVVLDPTFGYTSIGGSSSNHDSVYVHYMKATLTEEADVTSISYYCNYISSGNVTVGIYTDNSDNPNSKIATSENKEMTSSATWLNLSCTTHLDAGVYWLAVISNANNYYYYDSSANLNRYENYGLVYPNLADTATPSNWDPRSISIFVNYDVYVEPTPTPTLTPTPTSTATPTNTPLTLVLSEYDWIIFILLFLIVINFVLLVLPVGVLPRFIFALVSFIIGVVAIVQQLPFSPYLQLLSILVSLMCMLLAALRRG